MLFGNCGLLSIVLLSGFWPPIWNFDRAPGTMTLKIQTPQYIEGCSEKDLFCEFDLEVCIGSGRSENERCLWTATKKYSNPLQNTPKYLAEISFDVDNVRSQFHFNANITYRQNNKILKTERFNDVLVQFGNGQQLLHAEDYSTMSVDIDVKCKQGFYPKHQCTITCFDNPPIYKCTDEGKINCLKGYSLDQYDENCVADFCANELRLCQNNGTCINDIQGAKCKCPDQFSGDTCQVYDPCLNHKCKNGGRCSKVPFDRKYICHCNELYYGDFCENDANPCAKITCSSIMECRASNNVGQCVKKKTTIITTELSNLKASTLVTASMIRIKYISTSTVREINEEVETKEKVRFLQYHPFRADYTILATVVILIVFFTGVSIAVVWILKLKYKKKTSYANYPTLPIIPSVFNTSTYRSGEENFRRCHSLDESSFYICDQTQVEPYHTYRSGSHVWPKHNQTIDQCRESYPSINTPQRMCHSMMRTRMPMLCEPSTVGSSDLNFTVAHNSQDNSEKIDDFNNNYVGVVEQAVIDV